MLMCTRVFINYKSYFYHNKSTKHATHGKTCYSWQHLEVRGQTESYMLPSCHQCTIWSKSILVISEKKAFFCLGSNYRSLLGAEAGLVLCVRASGLEWENTWRSGWKSFSLSRLRMASIQVDIDSYSIWLDAFGQSMGKSMVQRKSERGGKEQRAHMIFTPWLRLSKDCTSVRKYVSNHPSIKLIHRRGGREGSWERDRDNLRLPIRSSFTCGYRTSWLA